MMTAPSPRSRSRAAVAAVLAVLALGGVGCASQAGGTALGAAPPPLAGVRPIAVRDLNHEASSGAKTVIVRGAMIEKCPAAGCWFKLRDASGVVRVDTKNAGFVVTDVPVGAILTVAGTPSAPAVTRAEPTLAAAGLRY